MIGQFGHEVIFDLFSFVRTAHQLRNAAGAVDLALDGILHFLFSGAQHAGVLRLPGADILPLRRTRRIDGIESQVCRRLHGHQLAIGHGQSGEFDRRGVQRCEITAQDGTQPCGFGKRPDPGNSAENDRSGRDDLVVEAVDRVEDFGFDRRAFALRHTPGEVQAQRHSGRND
jgi:hypothetical protein